MLGRIHIQQATAKHFTNIWRPAQIMAEMFALGLHDKSIGFVTNQIHHTAAIRPDLLEDWP